MVGIQPDVLTTGSDIMSVNSVVMAVVTADVVKEVGVSAYVDSSVGVMLQALSSVLTLQQESALCLFQSLRN